MKKSRKLVISLALLIALSGCSKSNDKYETAKESTEDKESMEVTNIDEKNPDESVVVIGEDSEDNNLENINPADDKFNNKISDEDKEKIKEESNKAEEKRKAEEAKKAEEKRKAEEAKKAEEKKKAEEAKKADERRKAEEAKKAEEKRKAEEAKKNDEQVSSSNLVGQGDYKLTSEKYGYGTAWDAKQNMGSKAIVKPGNYYIFSKSDGMLNLTEIKDIPGYWVNVGNSSSSNGNSANHSTENNGGERYQLNVKKSGYGTAWDAENNSNSTTNVNPGNYYIFSKVNGMLNITLDPSLPGTWINPNN